MVAGSRTSLAGTVASRSVAGVYAGEGGEATGAELRGVHPARVADRDVEALRHDAGDHDGIGADLVALVAALDAEVAGGVRQRGADVRRPGRQVPAQRPVVLHPGSELGRALDALEVDVAGELVGAEYAGLCVEVGVRVGSGTRAQSRSVVVGVVRADGPLADAEDHELGRTQRRDADEDDEPAVDDVVLRHRGAVAPARRTRPPAWCRPGGRRATAWSGSPRPARGRGPRAARRSARTRPTGDRGRWIAR